MKKIIAIFVVAIIGYFCFTVFYSGKKIDDFFTKEEVLYSKSGLTWELVSSDKGVFSGTYVTKVTYENADIYLTANITSKANFGLRDFNPTRPGTLISQFSLSDIHDIDLDKTIIKSDIAYGGISTVMNGEDGAFNQDDMFFVWKAGYLKSFFSYDRDVLDFEMSAPYFDFKSSVMGTLIENLKYDSFASDKEVGFWLGTSNFEIEKVLGFLRDMTFDIEKLAIASELKEGKNDTITSIGKIEASNIKVFDSFSKEGKNISNLKLNMDLENIDTKSAIKIYESLDGLDTSDQMQVGLTVLSWASYAPEILKKHPKFIFKDIGGKYENEDHSLTGFMQYVGDGNYRNYTSREDLLKDLKAEFRVKIGHNLFITLVENNSGIDRSDVELLKYELEEIEDDFNIKSDGKNVKIDFKIENGKIIINGKDVTKEL